MTIKEKLPIVVLSIFIAGVVLLYYGYEKLDAQTMKIYHKRKHLYFSWRHLKDLFKIFKREYNPRVSIDENIKNYLKICKELDVGCPPKIIPVDEEHFLFFIDTGKVGEETIEKMKRGEHNEDMEPYICFNRNLNVIPERSAKFYFIVYKWRLIPYLKGYPVPPDLNFVRHFARFTPSQKPLISLFPKDYWL